VGGAKALGAGRVHGEPGFRECVEIELVASGAVADATEAAGRLYAPRLAPLPR